MLLSNLQQRAVPLESMQPRFPAALVLGGEWSSVPCEALAYTDEAIAIPMLGMANSLNVVTAAAIALHGLVRPHRGLYRGWKTLLILTASTNILVRVDIARNRKRLVHASFSIPHRLIA